MNILIITLMSITALAIATVWPMRRLRQAVVGAACIGWGLTAGVGLVDSALTHGPHSAWEVASTVTASEATPAAAVTPTTPEKETPAKETPAEAPKLTAPLSAEAPIPNAVCEDEACELAEANDSLAPLTGHVIYPADRPTWVEAEFVHEGGEMQKVSVSSGPFLKKQEALRALDEELVEATRDYVVSYLGNSAAGTLVPVDVNYIKQHLITPGHTYSEVIQVSVGPMHQVHALVEFDPDFRRHLDERWRSIVVTGRAARTGVIAGGLLLLLTVIFGYFKADTATRGYYTTRLQLISATVVMALVAGGFVLFRSL